MRQERALMSDRLDALRRSRLAGELSDEQCRIVSDLVNLRGLKDGEILVREGQSDNHLYVIDDGLLGVVKNVGQPEQVTLFTIGSGEFVDELGFMDTTEHFASLVSIGETRVLGLKRE